MKKFTIRNLSTELLRYHRLIIFVLLIFMEFVFVANNWGSAYYAGIPAWYVILPVCIFFTAENAVKLWALKKFSEKIAFYVIDVLCLLVLTMFSDGSLISTLYIIILTEFYFSQPKLAASIAMWSASMVLFLVTFALTNTLKGIGFNVISLVSAMLNDLLLIALHFFIFNFALRLSAKNREIAKTLEELNESNEKLRIAYRELQEITVLEERQRIAKDIHDTAGHSITTVIMQTEAARLVIDSDPEDAKRKISAANLQAKHALEELRESVHLLSGTRGEQTLRDLLLEIVHDSTDGTGIAVRTEIDDVRLCDAKRRLILNTLKEGISNGLRHGNATAFWFELKEEDGHVNFLLSDNGTGMEIGRLKEGFGLTGMHRRAESLGGDVWFETEPGEGFEIHMTLPLDGRQEAL